MHDTIFLLNWRDVLLLILWWVIWGLVLVKVVWVLKKSPPVVILWLSGVFLIWISLLFWWFNWKISTPVHSVAWDEDYDDSQRVRSLMESLRWWGEDTWEWTPELVWSIVEEPTEIFLFEPWVQQTYAEIVPAIIEQFELTERSDWSPSFQFVSRQNELYEPFRIAQQYRLIWTNTNPEWIVRCWNYAVMYWIAAWRDVNTSAQWVLTSYYDEAQSQWVLPESCSSVSSVLLG